MKTTPTKVVGFSIGSASALLLLLPMLTAAWTAETPPACVPMPPGLVSWWMGSGDATDAYGLNHGQLMNGIDFAPGKVGQAFRLGGTNGYVRVPASPSLDVGQGEGMTIEAWINPLRSGAAPIAEWSPPTSGSPYGAHFWLRHPWCSPCSLSANLIDTSNVSHSFEATGPVTLNTLHHVALTYDKASGVGRLFLDGVMVRQVTLGTFTPRTGFDLYLGDRPPGDGNNQIFSGLLDEVSLYSRALSVEELQSIYNAGPAGKCAAPERPAIVSSPQSQTVYEGTAVNLSVEASGTRPLTYQWWFNGLERSGATNRDLEFPTVRSTDAGEYVAVVANAMGAATSAVATLTVHELACAPFPAGLAAAWRGEGDLSDVMGANPAQADGSLTYTSGKVGQAFVFDGTTTRLTVPSSAALATPSLTIEAWVYPLAVNETYPILEYAGPGTVATVHLWYSMHAPGTLYGLFRDFHGGALQLESAPGLIAANQWTHVALTFDDATGRASLYVNGVAVQSRQATTPIHPPTNLPINIGHRPSNSAELLAGRKLLGQLDEVSIYNRALTAEELNAICQAGALGKCTSVIPPAIIVQPLDTTVPEGASTSFHVSASGSMPLSYQWCFNSDPLAGATQTTLELAAAATADAGSYSVVITNTAGAVTSRVATLTVVPAPACVPPALGLVSWWRAEDDSADAAGSNPGTLMSGVTYAAGKSGRAFAFNGSNQVVRVPNAPALNPTNALTIEAWVYLPEYPSSSGVVFVGKDGLSSDRQYLFGVGLVGSQWYFRPHVGLPGRLALVDGRTPIQTRTWYHVAMTYDGAALKLYVNGVLDGSLAATGPIITTPEPLLIGGSKPGPWYFKGLVDELSLYSRALSADELAAVYAADSSGKCVEPQPPVILTQPQDRSVVVGESAAFGVESAGTAPRAYQWWFNGVELAGATSPALQITSVALADDGAYSVVVTNSAGAATSAIARLTVSPRPSCAPQPAALVSWWAGEGDAIDRVGLNHGLQEYGAGFDDGKVGGAFRFGGTNGWVRVPASASLDVGRGEGLTIEAWINPSRSGSYPIAEWSLPRSGSPYGTHFWLSHPWCSDCSLSANLVDINGNSHHMDTKGVPGTVTLNAFNHVALTYDKTSGIARLYLNGRILREANLGTFTPQTRFDLYLGRRPPGDGNDLVFPGLMDEVSLFSRALSPAEVQSIYTAASSGKCVETRPPSIVLQPQPLTVFEGVDVRLNVEAIGTSPLSYQWWFNGAAIADATNRMLSLPGVQMAQAGDYLAVVSNALGSATSAVATVTVRAITCAPIPAGIVGWWSAEGNTGDMAGTNHAQAGGSLAYTSGKAGQAFEFDGTTTTLTVPSSATLATPNLTIEGWVYPASVSEARPIVEYAGPTSVGTVHFWYSAHAPGTLYGLFRDFRGGAFLLETTAGMIVANQWTHVALTFDDATSRACLYVNGVEAKSAQATVPIHPPTNVPINIGHRPTGSAELLAGRKHLGKLDELSIYGRVLAGPEIQAIYLAGASGKCEQPVPPAIVSEPQDLTVLLGESAGFAVAAAGTLPLTCQWYFNTAPVAGADTSSLVVADATNATLALALVQFAQAGYYSVVVSNEFGTATSRAALLAVRQPPTRVNVVSVNAASGGDLDLPIQIVAFGNENALSFSLQFDPALLQFTGVAPSPGVDAGAGLVINTNVASSGRVGIALALPSATRFSAGTQEVLRVSLRTAPVSSPVTLQVTFGDLPTARQIADDHALAMPAVFTDGTVQVDRIAFEADVAPRPGGDHALSLIDWVQVGRFVAGFDTPEGAEFQRADCAPAATGGNGVLSITDWVQAGLYAAGVSAPAAAGGPEGPAQAMTSLASTGPGFAPVLRTLALPEITAAPGTFVAVPVRLSALGDESALGFSVVFDPTRLSWVSYAKGAGVSTATFNVNTNDLARGVVGFAIALTSGAVNAGSLDVVVLSFRVAADAKDGSALVFADQPIVREISDAAAQVVPCSYSAGRVTVDTMTPVGPVLGVRQSGTSLVLFWPVDGEVYDIEEMSQGLGGAWQTINVAPIEINGQNMVIIPEQPAGRFYRLHQH